MEGAKWKTWSKAVKAIFQAILKKRMTTSISSEAL